MMKESLSGIFAACSFYDSPRVKVSQKGGMRVQVSVTS